MKIRNGFVSNSSSSSFIIGVKKGNMNKTNLMKIFKIEKDSVLYSFAESLVEFIVNDVSAYTMEEYLHDMCYDSIEALLEDDEGIMIKKIIDKGYTLYRGSASNDCGEASGALCEMDINYEDDNIIFYKMGGF